jgi:hypothetical protein
MPDRPYFAFAPAIDATSGTSSTCEASAQHPGSEAPTGLAFTARVVPMPAAEVEASATRPAAQFQTSKAATPDRAETPALRPPIFQTTPKKRTHRRSPFERRALCCELCLRSCQHPLSICHPQQGESPG